MNIAKSLKKLASNQTFVVLAAIVAVAAVYYYSQGFNTSLSSMSGAGEAAKAVDQVVDPNAGPSDSQIQCAAGGNNFIPSKPLGQNGGNNEFVSSSMPSTFSQLSNQLGGNKVEIHDTNINQNQQQQFSNTEEVVDLDEEINFGDNEIDAEQVIF